MSLKSHSNAKEIFFDGFKNELRHLCPLNRIQIFKKLIAIPWTWVAPSMSLKSHSNARKKIGGLKNELRHLCPLNRIQIFQTFIVIPWKWTTACFKTDCGHNLLIEISFFNIFWPKYFLKNAVKFHCNTLKMIHWMF